MNATKVWHLSISDGVLIGKLITVEAGILYLICYYSRDKFRMDEGNHDTVCEKKKKKKTCTCVTPSRWHFFLVCSPNTLTQVNHVSGGDETKTKARRHYQKGKGLYSLKYNIVFKIFWGWINPSILQVLMYHRPYSNGPELRFQGQAWDSNFKPRLTIPHIVSGLPLPASEKIKLLFWWLVWFVSCFSTVIILSG